MAGRARVPQFGQWDSNNAQYTAVFDTARKDKGGTGPKLPTTTETEQKQQTKKPAKPNRTLATTYEQFMEQEQNIKKPVGRRPMSKSIDHYEGFMGGPSPSRSPYDQGIGSQFVIPEPRTPRHGSSRPSPTQDPARPPNYRHGHNQPPVAPRTKAPSVPKFGEWEGGDHNSAQGYTMVFNKVKEDRHAAATKIPTNIIPPDEMHEINNHKYLRRSGPWWWKFSMCTKPHARE